jgi:hypothetical protein
MQVQWKGMDLGRAVKIIKDAEAAEAKANEVDLAPVEVLHANFFGIKLPLRVFGVWMNAFLIVSLAKAPAFWHGLTRVADFAVRLRLCFASRVVLSALARPVQPAAGDLTGASPRTRAAELPFTIQRAPDTVCRTGTQGGMSALFAIGGYTIHGHKWVTIKVVRSASCLSTFDGG